MLNVATDLRNHALTRPDAAAIRFPSADYTTKTPKWDTWTYAELDYESDAAARGFSELGIEPGERTLVLVKPSLDMYAILFGLFKCGAVPVLLDPGMGMKNLLICIKQNEPTAVVAISPVHAVRVTIGRGAFSKIKHVITAGRRWFWGGSTYAQVRKPSDEPYEIVPREANDDAAIIFTSGSTGPAKGVASKQAMFKAQVDALRTMFDLHPGKSDLQCFAAFAIFDVCLGVTTILAKMDLSKPATADPKDILAALRVYEPEVAFASPVVWQNTSRVALEEGLHLTNLQQLLTVGAPIPAYLHRRFRKLLPEGSQVWTPYGATEAMPIAYIGTDEILAETWEKTAKGNGTCVGQIAPFVDLKIIAVHDEVINTLDEATLLPQGETGEIIVCGPQVSPEYKNAPIGNKQAKIKEGSKTWHRMGDLGYVDEQKRVWFCGRKTHRLTIAGKIQGAVPLEGIFNEHPDVFRTAVVGFGNPTDQVVVCCVEMEPKKAFTDDIKAQLVELAQGTKAEVVQRFLVHEKFPTDARHNSKIRREQLAPWAKAQCADLLEN